MLSLWICFRSFEIDQLSSRQLRLISGHLTGLRNLCVDWDLGVALSSAWDGAPWTLTFLLFPTGEPLSLLLVGKKNTC